jgi:tetraprenyl-beta-curcumene synthase
VAFQSLYDYLDTISEQPSADSFHNNRQLHRALVAALDPDAPHADYYALHGAGDDGGYLREQIDVCRAICATLPSFALAAPDLRRAAVRAMESQAHVHTGATPAGRRAIARWAGTQTPAALGLLWWESAAASGSSLAIHALLAVAADPELTPTSAAAIAEAYFPWAGALQGLLDSVVDELEDDRDGGLAYVGFYPTRTHAAQRLERIVGQTLTNVGALPQGASHHVIVAAMACLYLSSPSTARADAREIRRAVLSRLGGLGRVGLLVFWLRRLGAVRSGGLW